MLPRVLINKECVSPGVSVGHHPTCTEEQTGNVITELALTSSSGFQRPHMCIFPEFPSPSLSLAFPAVPQGPHFTAVTALSKLNLPCSVSAPTFLDVGPGCSPADLDRHGLCCTSPPGTDRSHLRSRDSTLQGQGLHFMVALDKYLRD